MDTKNNLIQIPFQQRLKKRINLVLQKKNLVISLLLGGIILAAAVSFILPKKYKSTSQIYFKYNSVNSSYLSDNGSLTNEIQYLNSDNFQENVIGSLTNKGIHINQDELTSSVEIVENGGASSIDVNVISDEGEKSAEISNTISEKFSEKNILANRSALLSTLKEINERDKSLQEDIRRSIASQQTSTTVLNVQQEQVISRISEFESELESIELDNNFYSVRLQNLQNVLERDFPSVSSNILLFNDTKLNESKVRLERLETKNNLSMISQKLGNFPIEYPWEGIYNLSNLQSVRNDLLNNIENFIDKIASENNISNKSFLKDLSKELLENQIKVNSIDFTKSIIFGIMTDLEDQFNRIPFNFIEVAREARTKKFNNTLAIKLKTKAQKLKDRENDFFAEIDRVITAEVPQTYFSPNTSLNIIIGALIGLIIGLFLAFSQNSTQIELIKTQEDLEESGFKIIAKIPSIPSGSSLLFDALNETEQRELDPKIIESFSNIETFLKYGSLDKPLKTIMVTSGQDSEGKSLIASNVALALANSDHKVLLVDADLKNPQLNKFFRIKSTPSLAHYLFRKKELNEIIRKTHNKNLDLITCIEFPQNPSVIITSERMKNFMSIVKNHYDYIVYDTSSLCSLKETAEIAGEIDDVILVVRANKTKLTEILTAKSILEENNITGYNVVLNDVST
ncbi:MAG: polysaccharide biosynthesis tyrosine autokinase [Ignavibacteriales bacterium]|nr:polysaccharide biosynthesis tyrosine autokinase [Ignavibacteriales bacterium]